MIGTEAEARRLKLLEKVAGCAAQLCDCAAEFLPEYPQALSEYWDALERALEALDAPDPALVEVELGDRR